MLHRSVILISKPTCSVTEEEDDEDDEDDEDAAAAGRAFVGEHTVSMPVLAPALPAVMPLLPTLVPVRWEQ
jgi:hypothetical protein